MSSIFFKKKEKNSRGVIFIIYAIPIPTPFGRKAPHTCYGLQSEIIERQKRDVFFGCGFLCLFFLICDFNIATHNPVPGITKDILMFIVKFIVF